VIGYNRDQRRPRAIPIGFHWNGAQFVLCTVPHAPKVPALKANPKVAFTVDTNAVPPHVLLVRGTAAIDIVDGVAPEYLAASRKAVGPGARDVQADGSYQDHAALGQVVGFSDAFSNSHREVAPPGGLTNRQLPNRGAV
jgi:Pyridoxamine 5'-phosphate oxidase